MSLGDAFTTFTRSAFRLETMPAYDVPQETAELEAYRAGRPMAERSVRTSAWLANMATTAASGRDWRRVRLIGSAPTLYESWELDRYVESQACGEQIRIAPREQNAELLGADYWLFDEAAAYAMRYTTAGAFLGADRVDDPQELADLVHLAAQLWERAEPLNEYLAAPVKRTRTA